MTSFRIRLFGGFCALSVGLAAAGCVGAGASPSGYVKIPATDDGIARTPLPAPSCVDMSIIAEQSITPRSMADLAAKSVVVVVGTFGGYGAAVWDTPDGKRPPAADFLDYSKAPMLERPISIDVQTTIRPPGPGTLQATVRGGQIGCDRIAITDDDTQDLIVGNRYLLFISPLGDINGNLSSIPTVVDAWPVGGGDLVQTPQEGNVPISAVSAVMARVPCTWPTPKS
jgi:hypothetical protein